MSHLVFAIAKILSIVLNGYMWIVIISALLSWVNPDPYNPIVRFLRGLTEPVFHKVRQWIPFAVVSGIDLSPIVVILALQVLDMVLVANLMDLAFSMRGGAVM
ncbi:YggT family protein [Desulfovibrio oxyclinae]|jgi:YggT family protein|uniref:YggT family protein n=1 Tax=Desulfovibrio oxyclinae TaxID=63560 RepID=UPI00036C67F1|nr:YggT family protein [Desulfovibrio oxyclinae]